MPTVEVCSCVLHHATFHTQTHLPFIMALFLLRANRSCPSIYSWSWEDFEVLLFFCTLKLLGYDMIDANHANKPVPYICWPQSFVLVKQSISLPPLSSSHISLPTRLPHTWKITRQRIQSEIILFPNKLAIILKPPIMLLLQERYCVRSRTYPRHLKITQNTTPFSTFNTSVLDLCRSGIAVHLCQLDLCLSTGTSWQIHISYYVAKSLSISCVSNPVGLQWGNEVCSPLGFMGREDLSFRMITDDSDVDIAANIEFFCAKHRHDGDWVFHYSVW